MSWINRSYHKFCDDCSWRHPRLSSFAAKIKFPVQLAVLCFTLYAFVSFYQKHYSFEATMLAHQHQQAITSAQDKSSPSLRTNHLEADKTNSSTDNSLTVIQVEQDSHSISPESNAQLEKQILAAENSLREQVQKAEQALVIKNKEADALKTKIANAKKLLDAESERTTQAESIAPTISAKQTDPLLLNGRWISKQRRDSYIIQLASSTKDSVLIEHARGLSSYGPLAIYPFTKTKTGKRMYGLSIGLYRSNSEATQAVARFPAGSVPSDTWIRKVSDVSSQIANFRH